MSPDLPESLASPLARNDPVYSFLVGALDSIAVGVMAVDRSLQLIHANDYARDVLDQGTTLALSSGALTCAQAGDTTRLRLAVARCLSGEVSSPIVFRLHDHRRAEFIEVAVRSASSDAPAHAIQGGLAAIYIRNPGPQPALSDTLLADLYGLTRAERAIASLLTQEGSVTVAAKVRGVSASTARTHLRSLLRKTGARRQVDLVQRLSTGLCGLVRFCLKERLPAAQAGDPKA